MKVRLNKYDNLRGIAIYLVVLGHLDSLHILPPKLNHFIFMIHLPLLFFVSGYFSKIAPDQPLKSFKRIMVPYLIFCIITKLYGLILFGKIDISLIFFQSSTALWFLIALFIMKMLLPIFDKFRYPIITALICALFIGCLDLHPNYLGLTRAFAYYPVFLVGYYLKQSNRDPTMIYAKIRDIFNRHFKLIFILVCISTVVVLFKFDPKFYYFKAMYSGNYLFEMIKRLIVILLEMAWVLILDKLMTNRECILTKFGVNSMAVYLLHIYVMIYCKTVVPDLFANNMLIYAIFLIALSIGVTFILSRDIVTKYLNKFTDGVYDLIVKPINS